MTDYCIGYVEKAHDKTTIHYALYASFEESKTTLLNIIATMGLQFIDEGTISREELYQMGNATTSLMFMREEELDPARIKESDALRAFGTKHMLVFIKRGDLSNIKDLVGDIKDLKIETNLMADHRKCTLDFCFGTLDTSLN